MQRPKNFYCSQKFWWLTVDLEKLETQSCCSAYPHKINLDFLKKNPGQLFNTPELQQERKMMLTNQPVASCTKSCWEPEQQGLISRRLLMGSDVKTHTNIEASPKILGITVGKDCNMTCVYCTKQYSSAWYRDILNKSYNINSGNRYIITDKDKVINQLSQKTIHLGQKKNNMFDELEVLCKDSNISKIIISGGEPFLYLYLLDLLEKLPQSIPIYVHSGLGVDTKKFTKILDCIKNKNVTIVVSGEGTNEQYEFIRYGNSWQRFITNLTEINKRKIKVEYSLTVSNISIFGIGDIIEEIGRTDNHYSLCTDPDFLMINVMDDKTKEVIYNNIDKYPQQVQEILKTSLLVTPTEEQTRNFKNYIIEFSNRRNLDLNIFPQSFIEWIKS